MDIKRHFKKGVELVVDCTSDHTSLTSTRK